MKVKFLLLITLLFAHISRGQDAVVPKPVYTIISTAGLIHEERATVRIAISKISGNTITGYRKKDNAFFIRSLNDASAKAVRAKIEKFYPKTVVTPTAVSDHRSKGFTDVNYRVILPDPAFPIYIETGDHELDETSYQYEKSDWQQAHPACHK